MNVLCELTKTRVPLARQRNTQNKARHREGSLSESPCTTVPDTCSRLQSRLKGERNRGGVRVVV